MVDKPIEKLPADPYWTTIAVPGDKNTLRPDLLFAHRLWYRTRVKVPDTLAGRSFVLTFPQNSLNTTVFVNGTYCGFGPHPFVHFDIDVSKAIKPGATNEIWVGIRDYWYGYSTNPNNPMKLREKFNLPPDFARMGFQDLAYPVWNCQTSGILVAPTLTAAGGPAYVSGVFVKPSVAQKQLAAEVTVTNSSARRVAGEIVCQAIDPATKKVALSLMAKPFAVEAGQTQIVELTGAWTDPRLWWPDDPQMYELRTGLKIGGKGADVVGTPFGFCQWGAEGKDFTLNGLVWHGWNVAMLPAATPDAWLERYRKTGQTQMRLYGVSQGTHLPFFGMSPDDALDWMDRHGVPVRRCGIIDGEAIGFMAVENDPDLKKLYGSEIKIELMNHWREQMAAQVHAERNHPSIQIWSIENEWLFINCINLYGGLMDQFEAEVSKVSQAVQQADPTRLTMTDGGGANKDNSMPVFDNHYVFESSPGLLTDYPARAYEAFPTGGGRGRWTWDEKRPRYLGEDVFYTGNHPELAAIGGEAALTGKAGTLSACGLLLSILQQGYRWADYGAWDFYLGPEDTDDSQWRYFAPRVVLCRQWDWTFASKQTVPRTLAIFNDTHSDEPITLRWKLQFPEMNPLAGSGEYRVAPGKRQTVELPLEMPATLNRLEGELSLTLTVKGEEVFHDNKAISVLPAPERQVELTGANKIAAGQLAVFDPAGSAAALLKQRGIPFTALADLNALPESAKVLLVGKDAVDPAESAASRLAAYATTGRAIVVLDQNNPLKYQALPADVETSGSSGRVGFAEDLEHPALRGLKDKDFFTWAPDELLYRQAYQKPTRGAKSLIQCGNSLTHSALLEVPVGSGVMLLSQLRVGDKLADNAVAQQLLLNLLSYGATYKQEFRPAVAVAADAPLLAATLDAIGLRHDKASDPLEAIAKSGGVAIITATPEHLQTLADHLPQIDEFTRGGGWLVVAGLTPDGLASFNKLVGVEHMIRPFKRERVTMAPLRRPVTAGITGADVTMYSGKRIFDWTAGEYVVSDEFTYVVDYDDVAPFAKSSFFAYDNLVNGFVNADGWPLIINFAIPEDGKPAQIPIELPKSQTIREFTWIGNTNYWPQTKVNLIFDGDRQNMAAFDVRPTGDVQVFVVRPPRSGKNITLEIAGWQPTQGKAPLIGIDNITLTAERPAEFYERVKPLLNIGALMEYPRGAGGILLCNLNFKPSEEVPANAVKKRNILAALLRNLRAPFAGKTVIAGQQLAYQPLSIAKQATAFRDDKGWFGDKAHTFRDLPTGKQVMAGVPYEIYEFPTSPVPTVVMVGGNGVPGNLPSEVRGIPINLKADALFFLQAAPSIGAAAPTTSSRARNLSSANT